MPGRDLANLPDHERCTARNGRGTRCKKPAMVGLEVCRTHGGAAPAAVAKSLRAKEAREIEKAAYAVSMPQPISEHDPEGRGDYALSMEIRRTVGWIRYCEHQLRQLGAQPSAAAPGELPVRDPLAEALGGLQEVERESVSGEERGERTETERIKKAAGVNVWEEKLRWNRSHLKDLTRQWINAGFEQKRLEVLTRTVDLFEKTLDGILRDLGHNPHDPAVRAILRDRLSRMQEPPAIEGPAA